jgi:hypothetical protein
MNLKGETIKETQLKLNRRLAVPVLFDGSEVWVVRI